MSLRAMCSSHNLFQFKHIQAKIRVQRYINFPIMANVNQKNSLVSCFFRNFAPTIYAFLRLWMKTVVWTNWTER